MDALKLITGIVVSN